MKAQHGFEGHILGGWEISGVSSFVSGSSFYGDTTGRSIRLLWGGVCAAGSAPALVSTDWASFRMETSPSARTRVVQFSKTKTRLQWFSTSSFAAARLGHFGNERVGSLLGPGVQKWDIATMKNVNLGEHLRFQLRGEYFNAFNHTNFWSVDSSLEDGNFGQVTTAHEPRIIQIGAKLNF